MYASLSTNINSGWNRRQLTKRVHLCFVVRTVRISPKIGGITWKMGCTKPAIVVTWVIEEFYSRHESGRVHVDLDECLFSPLMAKNRRWAQRRYIFSVRSTLVVCTAIATYFCYALFTHIFTYMDDNGNENLVDNWIFRLLLNLLGYGTVILPGFLLYCYVRNTRIVEKPGIIIVLVFTGSQFFFFSFVLSVALR